MFGIRVESCPTSECTLFNLISGSVDLLPRHVCDNIYINVFEFGLRFEQRHSIHGMMEEENVIRPHQEIQALTIEEKKFLLSVERGDVAGTRRLVSPRIYRMQSRAMEFN